MSKEDIIIERTIKEFDKAIKKAYKKIEKTGYPINPFNIAEMVIKGWWTSKEVQ